MLYPLSYEGASPQVTCQQVSPSARDCQRLPPAPTPTAEHTSTTRPGPTSIDGQRRPSPATVGQWLPTTTEHTPITPRKIIWRGGWLDRTVGRA